MRAPELHPNLQGNPSIATRTHRAVHSLTEQANLTVQLIELLRTCTGLRPCDPNSPEQFQADDHLRAIERGDLRRALYLVTIYGTSK